MEAELDRRYPGRATMRPSDAAGYREAWDVLEGLWPQTVARARRLDPESLHRRVNGEWSFIETLRHLVFATDAWVNRAILGQPSPWDPLDLPHDEMPDEPSVPRDRDARPSLDQVLALRADRMATVRSVLAGLTDEELAGVTRPVTEPGYPEPESFPVRRCLRAILNEEWRAPPLRRTRPRRPEARVRLTGMDPVHNDLPGPPEGTGLVMRDEIRGTEQRHDGSRLELLHQASQQRLPDPDTTPLRRDNHILHIRAQDAVTSPPGQTQ